MSHPQDTEVKFGDLKQRRYRESGKCSICERRSFYKVIVSGKGYIEFCESHKEQARRATVEHTREMKLSTFR